MNLTPDETIYAQWGPFELSATIVFTWVVMAILVVGSWLITRRLSANPNIPRGQNLLEIIVMGMRSQVREIAGPGADRYLPLAGTLFLFIAVSNLLSIVPGFQPPTGSLMTVTALALCGAVAVPVYGIAARGVGGYLRQYIEPTPLMLPFQIIGELSRTLALAVRLFGNVMSGTMIVGLLLAITPLFVPIIMQALGMLTGMVQAYIFPVLVMVYIASATKISRGAAPDESDEQSSSQEDE